MVFNQDVIFCNQRHFPFPMQIDYHKITACFLLFFFNQRERETWLFGALASGRQPRSPLDILRAKSSHRGMRVTRIKPTSAHIKWEESYYLLWASTDADHIVLFLSDHVCTSRTIRFITSAKMTPSRQFCCPVCVHLCFLNTSHRLSLRSMLMII